MDRVNPISSDSKHIIYSYLLQEHCADQKRQQGETTIPKTGESMGTFPRSHLEKCGAIALVALRVHHQTAGYSVALSLEDLL